LTEAATALAWTRTTFQVDPALVSLLRSSPLGMRTDDARARYGVVRSGAPSSMGVPAFTREAEWRPSPPYRSIVMPEIEVVRTPAQLQHVTDLSRGYVAWLIEFDKSLGVYDPRVFKVYGYERGEVDLPGEYRAPDGCLLLATVDSVPAGCVALRRLDERTCELRMLFVRPEFHGLGLGRALVVRLLEEARRMRYSSVRLDTSPHMAGAYRLYRSVGFREVAHDARGDSLSDIEVFMEKALG
jgi:ribosomal protein S18 acetylase RimI-like enzyme